MIDIDDFKRVNDSHGHLAGDTILRDVGDILRRSVRVFDVCARFGGEEFVIIMPGSTSENAMRIANVSANGSSTTGPRTACLRSRA